MNPIRKAPIIVLAFWWEMKELKSETCLKCGGKTENNYVLCEDCTPRYGQTTTVYDKNLGKYLTLFIGSIPFWSVIGSCLRGRRPIKWWMGTDALTMWFMPPGLNKILIILHRIKMRLLEPFIFQHWLTGPRLLQDLEKSGTVHVNNVFVAYWPGKYHTIREKKEHNGFNVLYYDPMDTKFQRWKYGIDIIEKIKEQVSGVNWIKADGTQDMEELFAITDLYIRPSRHDGEPRINIECELNNIPVIYSEDGNPEVEDFVTQINALKQKKLDEN